MIAFYLIAFMATLALATVSPWFLLCAAYCALGVVKELTW